MISNNTTFPWTFGIFFYKIQDYIHFPKMTQNLASYISACPACFLKKYSIQNLSFPECFPILQGYSKILEYVNV